jgi:hypothetical protein
MANTPNLEQKHDVHISEKDETGLEVWQCLSSTTFAATHTNRQSRHRTRPRSFPPRSKSSESLPRTAPPHPPTPHTTSTTKNTVTQSYPPPPTLAKTVSLAPPSPTKKRAAHLRSFAYRPPSHPTKPPSSSTNLTSHSTTLPQSSTPGPTPPSSSTPAASGALTPSNSSPLSPPPASSIHAA